MKKQIISAYIWLTILVAIVVATYGFMCPYLISYDDDYLVLLGIILFLIVPAICFILIIKVIKKIIYLTKIEPNEEL